jgi:hypothetical protein
MMLYEVIQELTRLNNEKSRCTTAQLRDAIEEQIRELQRIADSLIV